MGAWGPGPFENDAALDWLDTQDPMRPDAALRALSIRPGDADEEAAAIAAAAVVARVVGRDPALDAPVSTHDPADLAAWVALTAIAARALEEILKQGELVALWRETDELDAWMSAVADIRARLLADSS
jgi:hypothetical protein